ncbi:hypothetical protein [Pseudodesulfovibrio sp. zrk46]|uniref:hypothetical protein n=1 Tax=Pseudodesulfovibrio sp. zrk46 TaxID=2725288 RepID=UPI001448A585|nr:hypothetical protein [Pseudodesulfovibrio sp. zrk46]QJB56152.1 hypothetical protein HFN16_06880 [Pseudodesulfovibrio sp. zrk46]
MTRWKYALIVFLVVSTAGIAALTLDYTDTYVANRFHKALASDRYDHDKPFSLDSFLEYYDFDEVCVVTHDTPYPELKTQFGMPFKHHQVDEETWCLLFVKEYFVVAEIHIPRSELEKPSELTVNCFKRWEAIVEIIEEDGAKRLEFVGN